MFPAGTKEVTNDTGLSMMLYAINQHPSTNNYRLLIAPNGSYYLVIQGGSFRIFVDRHALVCYFSGALDALQCLL
jgi:hypothetical protein